MPKSRVRKNRGKGEGAKARRKLLKERWDNRHGVYARFEPTLYGLHVPKKRP